MAGRAKRTITVVVLVALGVLVGLALHRCYRHLRGIEVCLRNGDGQPMRSLEVAIRSSSPKSYALDDLAPGETTCVWIKADGEASVDVTFTMPSGAPKVVPLYGYIEHTYSGWISAVLTSEGARSIEEDIDFSF